MTIHAGPKLGWAHVFRPSEADAPGPTRTTLLLLHDSGGREHDLVDLARGLAPGAALLGPRGQVSAAGAARHYLELAPGVIDEADIRRRVDDLARFLAAAAAAYGLDPRRIVAAGQAHGAGMAAALLLLHPRLLTGAILLRPTLPLVPDPRPDLAGVNVFIGASRRDVAEPEAETLRLAHLFEGCRAAVTVHWHIGGPEVADTEARSARTWLRLTGLVSPA